MLIIHNIIYNELVLGKVQISSREKVIDIINRLQQKGAEGVILGCTELPMLISEKNVRLPIFDTTAIHASQAVAWALEQV
jgi:aspartate racemase